MDSIKIGRFIALCRKENKLTQAELAESLNISDKTVSKWECGNGLPEVSLMMPLCEKIGISVNELLSGERISQSDYRKKAEKNMMELIQENEESKKKYGLSMILGFITIIAVLSLVMLASFLNIPALVRVLFIAFAVVTLFFGIKGAAILDREAGVFECPECKDLFIPSMKDYVKGVHTFTKRKLTCPKCGKTSLCKHIITR